MEWSKYPSLIHESLKGLSQEDREGEWIVTEKIHGANFAVQWIPGEDRFRFYSRNQELGGEADFHGFRTAIQPHLDCIRKVGPGKEFIIYGELYGSFFPGKPYKSAIQKGIAYSPQVEFIAFDVMEAGRGFLPFDEAHSLCLSLGIDFVDRVKVGTFGEALEWVKDNVDTFRTTRQKPGMDTASPFFNPVAEGLVFRRADRHVLIKWRSCAFREKDHPREVGVEKKELLAMPFITEARVNNAVSKRIEPLGEIPFRSLFVDVLSDILDAMREEGLVEPRLEPKEKAALGRIVKSCLNQSVV